MQSVVSLWSTDPGVPTEFPVIASTSAGVINSHNPRLRSPLDPVEATGEPELEQADNSTPEVTRLKRAKEDHRRRSGPMIGTLAMAAKASVVVRQYACDNLFTHESSC